MVLCLGFVSAKLMAASTLGSMLPAAKWPDSIKVFSSYILTASNFFWVGLLKSM